MKKIKKYLMVILVICFAFCTKVLATDYEDATLEIKEIIADVSISDLLNAYETKDYSKINDQILANYEKVYKAYSNDLDTFYAKNNSDKLKQSLKNKLIAKYETCVHNEGVNVSSDCKLLFKYELYTKEKQDEVFNEIVSNAVPDKDKIYSKIKLIDKVKENSAPSDDEKSFCLDSSAIWQYIGYFLLVVKIIIPILIIILGMIDFGKAVTSNDDEAISKAGVSVAKRLIVGVAIFFVPSIISLIFSLITSAAPQIAVITPCEKCLLKPTGEECKLYKEKAEYNRKHREDHFIDNEWGEHEMPTTNNHSSSQTNSPSTGELIPDAGGTVSYDIPSGTELSGQTVNIYEFNTSGLSMPVYYEGSPRKTIKINEAIKDPMINALKDVSDFLNKNKDLYKIDNIQFAGTYNPDSAYAYPHKYALGIDLFNAWTYTNNGKTYSPYSSNGKNTWNAYNKFICDVCEGKEDCDLNLNYNIAKIFKKHGFCWGGDWKPEYFDPMHYEWHKKDKCDTHYNDGLREIRCN